MSKKSHTLLTVLAILGCIGLFLAIVIVIVIKLFTPSTDLSFNEKIGVIPIQGAIIDSRHITSQLVRFKKDKKIKAIILRINSPGGAVGPTQEIYREIRRTIKTKKVIASIGGIAASGGYYVASAADSIVANSGAITGSIGVIMEVLRFEDLLKKIGVSIEVIKSGEFKDIGSPHRKLTEREKELLNSLIKDIQSQFVDDVAAGRGLSVDKVRQIADGRIFSGARAKELGLVDRLGNFHDAVDLAKNLTGAKGDVKLVYPKKNRLELWELFFESAARSVLKAFNSFETPLEYMWKGPTSD